MVEETHDIKRSRWLHIAVVFDVEVDRSARQVGGRTITRQTREQITKFCFSASRDTKGSPAESKLFSQFSNVFLRKGPISRKHLKVDRLIGVVLTINLGTVRLEIVPLSVEIVVG